MCSFCVLRILSSQISPLESTRRSPGSTKSPVSRAAAPQRTQSAYSFHLAQASFKRPWPRLLCPVTPSKREISARKASMIPRMIKRTLKATLVSSTSSTWFSSTRNLTQTVSVTGRPPWKPKLRQKYRLFRPWPLLKCVRHLSESRRFKSRERKIWIVRQTPASLYLRKRKGSTEPSTRFARHTLPKSNRPKSSPHSRRPPRTQLFRVVATRWLQCHQRAWCAKNNLKIKSAITMRCKTDWSKTKWDLSATLELFSNLPASYQSTQKASV